MALNYSQTSSGFDAAQTLEDVFAQIDAKDKARATPQKKLSDKKNELSRKELDFDKRKKALLRSIDDERATDRIAKERVANRLTKITLFLSVPLYIGAMLLFAFKIVPALAIAIVSNGSEISTVECLVMAAIVYLPLLILGISLGHGAIEGDLLSAPGLAIGAAIYSAIFLLAVTCYPLEQAPEGRTVICLLPLLVWILAGLIILIGRVSILAIKSAPPSEKRLAKEQKAHDSAIKALKQEIAQLQKDADQSSHAPKASFQFSGNKISSRPGDVSYELSILRRVVARMESVKGERQATSDALDAIGLDVLPDFYRNTSILDEVIKIANGSHCSSIKEALVRYETGKSSTAERELRDAEASATDLSRQIADFSKTHNVYDPLEESQRQWEANSLKSQYDGLVTRHDMLLKDLEYLERRSSY